MDRVYSGQWSTKIVLYTDARYQGLQSIGDCDNDGKNEINAGTVEVESGKRFTEWIFK